MSPEQISEKLRAVSSEQLDHLESIWLSDGYPDIAGYLRQSTGSSGFRCGLVELDLEYRWKRYREGVSMESRDKFGFPLFPRVEDYANLLNESERPQIMNPRLLAEEYRVRQFWGDHPSRRQFLDRIPKQSDAIEMALARIDTEFEVEGMTPLDDESASAINEESTLLNHLHQATSEINIPSPNIGKYQLKSLLGRGGFGEVWKAYDPNLKRHVALKFPRPERKFSPDLMDYFRREAQKMAALEQVPGVVPVYEAGESNGVPYIVSFLVEGNDLHARFKTGSLTLNETVRIVADVAETLHRAHLSNLWHRDVKLSNILVNREGRAYLSDFGLCVSEEEQLHEAQSLTGTYAYMSPEQIQGQSHRVDGRADIYSLGVVLYRLITNRLPYVADTPAEYMDQVLHREPRPPRSIDDRIPAELERICLKCLKKHMSERYTTAADLAEELRAWLNAERPDTRSEPLPAVMVEASVRSQPARQILFAGIFGVSCIIAGGYAISYFWESNAAPSPSATAGRDASEGDNSENVRAVNSEQSDNGMTSDSAEENLLILTDLSAALSQRGAWNVMEKQNAVLVYSDRLTMKKLGEITTEKPLQLEITIQEMEIGSKVGIFFGMSEPAFNSQDASWQVLNFHNLGDETIEITLEARQLDGIRKGTQGLGHRILSLPKKPFSVVMSISDEGLKSLSVHDQNLHDLISEYEVKKPSASVGTGWFGLTCQKGTGIFSKPIIDQTPMTLTSDSK